MNLLHLPPRSLQISFVNASPFSYKQLNVTMGIKLKILKYYEFSPVTVF